MPQFDVSVYGSQIFWFFVSFFVLWGLMQKVVLPGVEKIFFYRRKHIQKLFEDIGRVQQETRELIEFNQRAREELKIYVRQQVSWALEQARLVEKSMKADQEDKFQQELHLMDTKIDQCKAEALRDINSFVPEIVHLIHNQVKNNILSGQKTPLSK